MRRNGIGHNSSFYKQVHSKNHKTFPKPKHQSQKTWNGRAVARKKPETITKEKAQDQKKKIPKRMRRRIRRKQRTPRAFKCDTRTITLIVGAVAMSTLLGIVFAEPMEN